MTYKIIYNHNGGVQKQTPLGQICLLSPLQQNPFLEGQSLTQSESIVQRIGNPPVYASAPGNSKITVPEN